MIINITEKKGADIPKEFIGLFIEDINYAVDGDCMQNFLKTEILKV